MRRYWCWTFGAACLLCIGVALVVRIFLIANASSYLRSAIRDYGRGNYESALTAANAALLQSPRLPQASLIAGQAAAKMERVDEALHYLRQIEFDGSATAIQGCLLAGRLSFDQGRAAEAERWYRAVVDQDFYQQEAHTQLAYLLGVEGRCFEAAPHLLAGIVSGDYTLHHLILLASSDGVIHDEAFVDRCLREVPDDESVRLGTARTAMKDGRLREALPILRAIVRHSPQLLEAQARLGEVLLESDSDLVSTWQGALPTETADHPEIWAVKGLFCEKRGQFPESARCYWEVVKRDPNHRRANYRLGQVLIRLQRSSEAQSFLQRAELLKELHLAADQAFRHPESRSWKLKVATLCESLGRPWESWAWTNTALAPDSPESDRSLLQTRRKLVLPETPQTLVDQNPASHIDLSDLPLPAVIAASRQAVAKLKSSGSSVHFRDASASCQLNFTYFNGTDPANAGIRMFETTGGGVGVVDYDQDGWPDLFFPQGGNWPYKPGESEYTDRLFRNHDGIQAVDASVSARIVDQGYSQGVAVGDFNNDGFPDLYVAHIGRNQLYVNQGDGTFDDITQFAGLDSACWTTSCLIADLNGDSLPDLYDVNYLAGDAIHSTICRQGDELQSCSAASYEAEQDAVYLNLGDGRFQNVTKTAGILAPDGRGLGIVAADFDGSRRINLFVANDAVPNFYFVNQSAPGGSLRFIEEAVPRGLAFDRDGLAQACMGVAAGDADRNGLLDLFVTNFHDESNTLYLQQTDGVFTDATRNSGLREPSYPLVGFGTQFLDGELDGLPDLVVTNGHVYDLSYQGRPYRMSPQYFRNLGGGRFEELGPQKSGDFFSQKLLGRGLARLDWNRDGREDFAVSHLNSAAALVLNDTPQADVGHYFAIQLRGTASNRDAIGTRIRIVTASNVLNEQLTAGDGYESSNQRQIIVGTGTERRVIQVEVRWLSGLVQAFGPFDSESEIMIVEGCPRVHKLSRKPLSSGLKR